MFYYRFYTHRQINVHLETTDPRPHSRSTANSYRLLSTLNWMNVDESSLYGARQTLASQLSCNSCSRLTRAWELRKLSCKLSLINSHQLLFDHAELNETYSSLMINCQMRFYLASTLSKSLYAQSVNRHRFVNYVNFRQANFRIKLPTAS
jgi:hypothetical protein